MPPDPVLFVLAWAPLAVLRLLGADRCARWLNDRARRRTEQGDADA